jgi:hypothetical protein
LVREMQDLRNTACEPGFVFRLRSDTPAVEEPSVEERHRVIDLQLMLNVRRRDAVGARLATSDRISPSNRARSICFCRESPNWPEHGATANHRHLARQLSVQLVLRSCMNHKLLPGLAVCGVLLVGSLAVAQSPARRRRRNTDDRFHTRVRLVQSLLCLVLRRRREG